MLSIKQLTRKSNILYRAVAQRTYSYHSANLAHEYSDPRNDKNVHVMHSRGVNVLHDPLLSKGTAFSIAERERLSIRGLVPPRCQAMDKQLLRVKRNLDACETPLAKFVFLAALHDRNETLYYKIIMEHLEELAGIIYTPTGKYIYIYIYI
jgi:malate dehydrogenase (oxaloacetate-decarboxylating)(NADP+)